MLGFFVCGSGAENVLKKTVTTHTFRLTLASILVLTSSIVTAAVEQENCHGDEWDGRNDQGDLVI